MIGMEEMEENKRDKYRRIFEKNRAGLQVIRYPFLLYMHGLIMFAYSNLEERN